MSALVVCAGAICSYPLFFCDLEGAATFSIKGLILCRSHIKGVLLHSMALYLGPITASFARVYEIRRRLIASGKAQGAYPKEVFRQLIKPNLTSLLNPVTEEERWRNIRNFIVAPLTEEIIFRGCMVPALLGSGMSILRVALIAPLFFGVAHLHHAVIKLSKGERMLPVLLMTLFQLAYTSLFGSYVAYAFIRTGSVAAVTISHAYCNWMGLPDFSFMQVRHPMHSYRYVLLAAYMTGALTFKWFFSSDHLLPLPSILPESDLRFELELFRNNAYTILP